MPSLRGKLFVSELQTLPRFVAMVTRFQSFFMTGYFSEQSLQSFIASVKTCCRVERRDEAKKQSLELFFSVAGAIVFPGLHPRQASQLA